MWAWRALSVICTLLPCCMPILVMCEPSWLCGVYSCDHVMLFFALLLCCYLSTVCLWIVESSNIRSCVGMFGGSIILFDKKMWSRSSTSINRIWYVYRPTQSSQVSVGPLQAWWVGMRSRMWRKSYDALKDSTNDDRWIHQRCQPELNKNHVKCPPKEWLLRCEWVLILVQNVSHVEHRNWRSPSKIVRVSIH
jgi:hypothetical protein